MLAVETSSPKNRLTKALLRLNSLGMRKPRKMRPKDVGLTPADCRMARQAYARHGRDLAATVRALREAGRHAGTAENLEKIQRTWFTLNVAAARPDAVRKRVRA